MRELNHARQEFGDVTTEVGDPLQEAADVVPEADDDVRGVVWSFYQNRITEPLVATFCRNLWSNSQ